MTEEEQKEKLNDLKNRISFALKDGTLQQGFEIICKRIAELEKGNEELVDKKTAFEKRIFELEKGNADLKAEIGLNEITIQDQLEDRVKLIKENEDLKKNALVWHKVTCFDKPNENGCITYDAPAYDYRKYLVRTKRGHYSIQELMEVDSGVVFDDYEWEDVDAWAELSEV